MWLVFSCRSQAYLSSALIVEDAVLTTQAGYHREHSCMTSTLVHQEGNHSEHTGGVHKGLLQQHRD